jgi:hypothetical protein
MVLHIEIRFLLLYIFLLYIYFVRSVTIQADVARRPSRRDLARPQPRMAPRASAPSPPRVSDRNAAPGEGIEPAGVKIRIDNEDIEIDERNGLPVDQDDIDESMQEVRMPDHRMQFDREFAGRENRGRTRVQARRSSPHRRQWISDERAGNFQDCAPVVPSMFPCLCCCRGDKDVEERHDPPVDMRNLPIMPNSDRPNSPGGMEDRANRGADGNHNRNLVEELEGERQNPGDDPELTCTRDIESGFLANSAHSKQQLRPELFSDRFSGVGFGPNLESEEKTEENRENECFLCLGQMDPDAITTFAPCGTRKIIDHQF